MERKEVLTKSIDYLKSEIQYMIDKQKKLSNKDEIAKLEQDKKEKISKLKDLSKKLMGIVREERLEKQKQNEIKMAGRCVDSIEFGGARKKNDHDAMTKAKKAKEMRDKAREIYNAYLVYEQNYDKVDPKDIPGMLFLHNTVTLAYGICPYIKIELENLEGTVTSNEKSNEIRELRQAWLKSQEDNGKVYFELYDKIVVRANYVQLEEARNQKQSMLDDFLQDLLTETQFKLFMQSVEYIQEYTSCHIKTKRMKEKFKMVIHNMSILYSETQLPIHEYIETKNKCSILINILDRPNTQCDTKAKLMALANLERFDELLQSFKQIDDECEQKKKYISNTLKNLKNELYMYITGQWKTVETQTQVFQAGKYFKRWAVLTEAERNERFESFANFHVQKFMVNQNILKDEEKAKTVVNLCELLVTSYKKKHLIYRDFKWSTSKGYIESMHVLRYDKDTLTFYLANQAGNQAAKRKDNLDQKSKRKSSIRSVITKTNEKAINEEILHFIVNKIQSGSNIELSKEDKEKCTENIKEKLKLKKLNTVDKNTIHEKYNEIFKTVTSHSASMLSMASLK